MMNNIKLVEGYPLYYNGVIYLVKGYQHPQDKIIAYPRYTLLEHRKLRKYEINKYVSYVYWDCIKQIVPVIDVSHAYSFYTLFHKHIPYTSQMVKETISQLFGVNDLFITGSSLVFSKYNDIDIVILGVDTELINRVQSLISRKIIRRAPESCLVREYLLKHSKDTDLTTYLYLKKDTISHIIVNKIYVNIKYVSYSNGFTQCMDPVEDRKLFRGRIQVIDCINKHILPTRYIVRVGNKKILMETFREMYSEIPLGEYYVEGYIEYRETGEVLVPDHGYMFKL